MIKCAIVGASGLVGNMFLKILEEKKLKIDEYVLFASYRSKGKKIKFNNKKYVIQELKEDSFNNKNFNYALFSAGSEVSKKYIPIAVKNNITVIDNSSYFRMNKNIPLVVPEINMSDCKNNKIISNPNCSTIQEVLPLYVLNNKYKIKRVIFTTFQAVSGSGIKGINDLINTRKEKKFTKYPYNITNNCIPHIDEFTDNDYTKEEIKMIDETKKILNLPNLKLTATCVRVPVINCHSESINIEFENEIDIKEIKKILNTTKGIKLIDDIQNNKYPINELANGTDDIYVGRIRKDYSNENTINIWVVSDNIRKGAATNAVQILEKLIDKQ